MARELFTYFDVDKEIARDEIGDEISNFNKPYIYSREEVKHTIQLVKNWVDKSETGHTKVGLIDSVSFSAVVDNDFDHFDKGFLVDPISGAITEIEISGLSNIPQSTGKIRLVNAGSESDLVDYTEVVTSGSNYVFTVSVTLDHSYVTNDIAQANDPALIKSDNSSIDSSGKDTGLFIVTLDADTAPYILEIEGDAEIKDCQFELKGFSSSGKSNFVGKFDFTCRNTLDDEGALPPPSDSSNFYNKSQSNAKYVPKDGTTVSPGAATVAGDYALLYDSITGDVKKRPVPELSGAQDFKSQSTAGLIWGAEPVINGDNISIDFDAFSGVVVDVLTNNSYDVSMIAQNVINDDLGERLTIYALDKDSNIIQLHENIDCVAARRYSVFAASITIGGVIVKTANIAATTPYSVALSLSDFWDEFGPITREKNLISANGANLAINMREFKTNFTAINFNDPECPNQKVMQAQIAPTLERYWSDGVVDPSTGLTGYNVDFVSFIDPTVYDDKSGSLVTIADEAFTIRSFYIAPEDEQIVMFVGTEQFSNSEGALSKINQFLNEINLKETGRTLQYLRSVVVRKDTTALNSDLVQFPDFSRFEPIYDNLASLGDGLIQNPVTVTYETDGVDSSAIITALNDPHVELKIDGYSFEVLSPVTIALAHGTAIAPTPNNVYFTQVGDTVQLNNTQAKPTVASVGRFVNVLESLIPDAVTMDTAGVNGGPRSWQQVVNYFASAENQSMISILTSIARESTKILSGCVASISAAEGATSDAISSVITSGSIRQLTPHPFLGQDTAVTPFLVPNDFTAPYVAYNTLNEILTDTTGATLGNNARYSIVSYVMQDEDGSNAKIYMNAPRGFYNSDSGALEDLQSYADYTTLSSGTCQLMQEIVCKRVGANDIEVLKVYSLTEGISRGGDSGGATKITDLTDTDATPVSLGYFRWNAGADTVEYVLGGVGEANTASNAGTGLSVFYQKNLLDLEFNGVNSLSNVLEVTLDVANHNIDFDINQSNISITYSQVTNFQAGVSLNSDVVANKSALSGVTAGGKAIQTNATGITGADLVTNVVSLTQAEYDAITDPATNYPTTEFNITDA